MGYRNPIQPGSIIPYNQSTMVFSIIGDYTTWWFFGGIVLPIDTESPL